MIKSLQGAVQEFVQGILVGVVVNSPAFFAQPYIISLNKIYGRFIRLMKKYTAPIFRSTVHDWWLLLLMTLLFAMFSLFGITRAQEVADQINNFDAAAPTLQTPGQGSLPTQPLSANDRPPPTLEQLLEKKFGLAFDPSRHNFVPDLTPNTAPFFGQTKIGQPYQVEGKWFYPFFPDKHFVEVGVASWYGDDFHGLNTANGGQFNMNLVSAAHRTLPLPAVVVVSNLTNGRQIKLIINDRGPFAKDRVLDLSKKAADLLGYYGGGTTRVRIIFLPEETKALWTKLGQQ